MNGGDISRSVSRCTRSLKLVSGQIGEARERQCNMIRDFEKGRRMPTIDGLEAMRRALEAKGIILAEEKGGDLGVRLKKADRVIRATWDPPPER